METIENNSKSPVNTESENKSTWRWGDEKENSEISSNSDDGHSFKKLKDALDDDLDLQIKALEEFTKKTKK